MRPVQSVLWVHAAAECRRGPSRPSTHRDRGRLSRIGVDSWTFVDASRYVLQILASYAVFTSEDLEVQHAAIRACGTRPVALPVAHEAWVRPSRRGRARKFQSSFNENADRPTNVRQLRQTATEFVPRLPASTPRPWHLCSRRMRCGSRLATRNQAIARHRPER